MAEFPERIGIAEVPLGDLGFSMSAPEGMEMDGSGLTVRSALELFQKLSRAEEQVHAEGSGTGLIDAVCHSISQATSATTCAATRAW